MKLLFTLLLSGCCLVATAQKKSHSNLSQHIHDDGKTMSVVIKGDSNGQAVDYNRTFNIAGMSSTEKDELTKRITDSLGISSIHRTKQPQPPVEPPPPPTPVAVNDEKHENHHVKSDIDDDGKTMHIKLSGTQKNRSFSYNRTFKVQGMTAKEKNALIKHITDSLGVTKNVQLSTN